MKSNVTIIMPVVEPKPKPVKPVELASPGEVGDALTAEIIRVTKQKPCAGCGN